MGKRDDKSKDSETEKKVSRALKGKAMETHPKKSDAETLKSILKRANKKKGDE
jgi:hypothetical protein